MTALKSTFIALGLGLIAPLAMAAPLTFTVEDVEARGGTLYIGVQTREQFMQWDGVDGNVIEAPTAGSHTVTFDLPVGDYSVSVWHDLDGDGEFDTAANGMPLDGWAMINGSGLRSAPTFDLVKITVSEGGAAASEKIIYASAS